MRAVAEEWLERHVRGNSRTERERGRIISRYIVPQIGDRVFADVRRKDIAELLDRIEDESGKQMADGVLKTFRAISKWVQQRDESYNPPLTAGMSRVPKGEGRRKRILADDEIRAIWACEGQYGDFVRLALLTAQRREKLIHCAGMILTTTVYGRCALRPGRRETPASLSCRRSRSI